MIISFNTNNTLNGYRLYDIKTIEYDYRDTHKVTVEFYCENEQPAVIQYTKDDFDSVIDNLLNIVKKEEDDLLYVEGDNKIVILRKQSIKEIKTFNETISFIPYGSADEIKQVVVSGLRREGASVIYNAQEYTLELIEEINVDSEKLI